MAEQKHTPGPWIFSEFCKADGSPIETVDDVADTVRQSAQRGTRAQLFGVSLDDADTPDAEGRSTVVCYTGNGPNAHNNARLIAAAPDLLAACKTLIRYATQRDGAPADIGDVIMTFVEDGSTLNECLDAAAGAIDKAEGR